MKRKELFLSMAALVLWLLARPMVAQTIEGDIFVSGTGLQGEYVMPDNITEIADYAFFQSEVTKVTLSKNLKKIGILSFGYCFKLTEVVFPERCKLEFINQDAFNECTAIVNLTLPDGVRQIEDRAFWGCTGLKHITLPENLDTLKQHVFQNCSSLTKVAFPKQFKVLGNNAFAGCTALSEVEFTSLDSLATKAFYGCKSLKEIALPANLRVIADSAFMRCEALTSLTLPKSVETVGVRLTRRCPSFAQFKVEEGSEHFAVVDGILFSKDKTTLYECPAAYHSAKYQVPQGTKRLAPYSFFECDNVESIAIPKDIERIGVAALSCNGMKEFLFDGNEHYALYDGALHYLRKDDAGNTTPAALLSYPTRRAGDCHVAGGTLLIAQYAFSGAKELENVTLPGSLVGIDTCAMQGLTALKSITCKGEVPPLVEFGAFDNTNTPEVICYVPKGCLQTYAKYTVWLLFKLTETNETSILQPEAIQAKVYYIAASNMLYSDLKEACKGVVYDTAGRAIARVSLAEGEQYTPLVLPQRGHYLLNLSNGTTVRL